MSGYTEEKRLKGEYPEVGEKVILNILKHSIGAEDVAEYNGSELVLVENSSSSVCPLFYCHEHGFSCRINNMHFKAIGWPKVGDKAVSRLSGLTGKVVAATKTHVCIEDGNGDLSALRHSLVKKPFDIRDCKFTDEDIEFTLENGKLLIEIDSDRSIYGEIKRVDAIAIAKHFNLTANDLK